MFRPILIPLLVAALGATAAPTGSAAAPPTRVTIIGDSIASAMSDVRAATRILSGGVELDVQVAVCRRLVGESCPYQGTRPLTLVDLLPTLRLGSTVVVAVGYNDFLKTFPESVETALEALRKEGVEHVLWVTLRVERESYLTMNEVIRAAAEKHPELTVVDWNLYSRSHPDWFQDDGLHLNSEGAIAMATLIHRNLDALGLVAAPIVRDPSIRAKTLPAARVGRSYLVRLTASGGVRPISWAWTAGTLPAGLRFRRDGMLSGTPRLAGRLPLTLRVTDARGRSASRRFVVVVRPPVR